ncbi:hypothetical protein AYL99_09794 [Fonsecaea erecta]|uniref:Uncharacterized protein n=1 Tax=Fonsecaea erecta TaxID=1367422 RepID=A0A178Z7G3_9EURO|nr:hypothetical protein AYL99_09794 [Fonsecaea erecta]OAP55642.1 hypothetical protein AYL99_09794 [Fonsecaea erecta]
MSESRCPGDPPDSPVRGVLLRNRFGSEAETESSDPNKSSTQPVANDVPPALTDTSLGDQALAATRREAVQTMRKIRGSFSDHDAANPFYMEVPLTFEAYKAIKSSTTVSKYFRKCRTQYFAQKQVFVVMSQPGDLHSYFITMLSDEIERQMQHYRENGTFVVSKFVKETARDTDFEVELPASQTGRTTLHLDLNFRHHNRSQPRVIIQVATTQPAELLGDIAEAAIMETKGEAVLVIGVKLSYPNSKRATISVWRSDWLSSQTKLGVSVKTIVNCQEFIRDDGSLNLSCEGIHLNLPDLVGRWIMPRCMIVNVSALDLGRYAEESRLRDEFRQKQKAERNAELNQKCFEAAEPSEQPETKVRKEGRRVRFVEVLDDSKFDDAAYPDDESEP